MDENFSRGVFWGQELESGVRFLKFSPEGRQIGPPTAKTAIFKSCLDFNETRSRGVFWGVEHESELRFYKFSSEVGEIGPPTAKTSFLKPPYRNWQFSLWEVRFHPLLMRIYKIGVQIRVLRPKKSPWTEFR